MRPKFTEKPKAVRMLAHIFTKFMCSYKIIPVFKISPDMFEKLLNTPREYREQVFIYGRSEEGVYGKMFGVEFVTVANQKDSAHAVDAADFKFDELKKSALVCGEVE